MDPEEVPLATIPERHNLKSLFLRTVRSISYVVIVLSLIGLWLNFTGLSTGLLLGDMSLKPPAADDQLQAKMADEQKNIALCGRISDQASVVRPFDRGGRQAVFLNSECYFDLAVRLKDDLACANVRPVSTGWLDGSAITPERCMSLVRLSRGAARPAFSNKAGLGANNAPLKTNQAQPNNTGPAAERGSDGWASNPSSGATSHAGTAANQAQSGQEQPQVNHPTTEGGSDEWSSDAPEIKADAQLKQDGLAVVDDKESEQRKFQDVWDNWKRQKRR